MNTIESNDGYVPKWAKVKDDIVISGISGVFPNSADMNALMDNLYAGVNCVNSCRPRYPQGIFGIPKFYGNVPDDLDRFDAQFFGYDDNTANETDYQIRLLMEKTYEAIVDSGTDPVSIKGGRVGYFAGSRLSSDRKYSNAITKLESNPYQSLVSSVTANKVFSFCGPSTGVDSACASSFTALDQAMVALRTGECDSALIATFMIDINIPFSKMFTTLKMTSPESKCKAFDASADGYGRAEAMVVIFLQKKCDAKRLYAIIRGIESSADGYKKEGVTFPRWDSQARLISRTFKNAGINPFDVKYIETHATGTKAGDPVECKAIAEAMCRPIECRSEPLLIGAVKSNIGHTEWASGLAAVAKVIIAYENKCIPKNINLNTLNPDIPELFDGSLKPITENIGFEGGVVAVNNFGFGGSNSHLILESAYREATEETFDIFNGLPRLVLMCARSEEALNTVFEFISNNLLNKKISRDFLALINDISRQENMPVRGSLLIDTDSKVIIRSQGVNKRLANICFYFGGNGYQCSSIVEMMKLKTFAETIEKLSKLLMKFEINLFEIIDEFEAKTIDSKPIQTIIILITFQISLINILTHLDIKPNYMICDGFGVLAGAYAAGALTEEDVLTIAYLFGSCLEDEDYDHVITDTMFGNLNRNTSDLSLNYVKVIESSLSIALKKYGLNVITKPENWLSVDELDEINFSRCLTKVTDLGHVKEVFGNESLLMIEILSKSNANNNNINDIQMTTDLNDFLLNTAKVYELGFNPKVENLYPSVNYPVVRGTPFISPLVKWDHTKQWSVVNLNDAWIFRNRTVHTWKVRMNDPEYECLSGHIIDGRLLFPGVGYVYLAWKAVLIFEMKELDSTAIELINLNISHVTAMSKDTEYTFKVNYDRSSHSFQVTEAGTVCATGQLFVQNCSNVELEAKIESRVNLKRDTNDDNWLTSSDFYKEMKLRGYDHQDEFRGVERMRFDGSESQVIWRNNWIPFLDSVLQIHAFNCDCNHLFVPVALDKVRLDPSSYSSGGESVGVFYEKYTDNSYCKGIDVFGVKFKRIVRKVDQMVRYESIELSQMSDTTVPLIIDNNFIEKYLKSCEYFANILVNNLSHELLNIPETFTDVIKLFELDYDRINQYQFLEHLFDTCKQFTDNNNTQLMTGMKRNDLNISEDILFETVFESKEFLYPIVNLISENLNIRNKITFYEMTNTLRIVLPFIEDIFDINNRNICSKVLHNNNTIVEEMKSSATFDIDYIDLDTPGIDTHFKGKQIDFFVYRDISVNSLKVNDPDSIERLYSLISHSIVKNGFLLSIFRVNSFQFESIFTKDLDLDNNHKMFSEFMKTHGFVVINEKYDNLFTNAILWRKVNTNIAFNHKIWIQNNDYQWIESYKEVMNKSDTSDRIWLMSDQPCNGIYGLANCLRKEPRGEMVRILIGDILTPDCEIPKDVLQKDLFQNHITDGVNGCYTRSLINDKSVYKLSDHSFIRPKIIGDLSSMEWTESEHRYWEIEARNSVNKMRPQLSCITVYNTGMNFKDVMLATGRLPAEKLAEDFLCIEFSGKDQNGNRVMGFTDGGALATKLVTYDVQNIWSVPQSWTLEEASTVPIAYGTTYYSLLIRGQLKQRERVLIHSGSGGVGYAAIRVCMSMDCDIFTTVGSEEKKQFLIKEFPDLSENQILNSRDTSFVAKIMNITNGLGVDLILNSLSGDKLIASAQALAKNGRFVEIGRYDMTVDTSLDLSLFGRNNAFQGIIFDLIYNERYESKQKAKHRAQVHQLIQSGITCGVVKPLPRIVFDVNAIEDAFRFMSAGKHRGKVVIKLRDECYPQKKALIVKAFPKFALNSEHSVLITGGLGGFGLELVKWLTRRGVKNIVITSRSGQKTSYHKFILDKLKASGVNVVVWVGDATKEEEAIKLLKISESIGQTVAIFHLAMILNDSLLVNQSIDKFARVSETKYLMAKHLDTISRRLCPNLRYFVVFSSIASGMGNAGQSNYGYGNGLCEQVCRQRREEGLHGLAIQWGPIGDVGFIADTMKVSEIENLSIQRMPSCLLTLDQFLDSKQAVISSKIKSKRKADTNQLNLLSHIRHIVGINKSVKLDVNSKLLELGIDSLMAAEIKLIIEDKFKTNFSDSEIRNLTVNDVMALDSSYNINK